jgi:hypothetical protein
MNSIHLLRNKKFCDFYTVLIAVLIGVFISLPAAGQWSVKSPKPGDSSDNHCSNMVFDTSNSFLAVYGVDWTTSTMWIWWCATPTWVKSQPATAPEARAATRLAYDSTNNRIILYGGTATSDERNLDDTWAYDGSTFAWTCKKAEGTAGSPPGRDGHALAFDALNSQVILFGGYGTTYRNDTWAYNYSTNTWTQKIADGQAGSPPARTSRGMAYDPVHQQVVLFGGNDGSGYLNDTWVWNNSTTSWIQKSPATVPTATNDPKMFWSDTRKRVILIITYPVERIYEWDGTDWTQMSYPTLPSAVWVVDEDPNGEFIASKNGDTETYYYAPTANAAPVITHTQVTDPPILMNTDVTIYAGILEADEPLTLAKLYYKINAGSWQNLDMTPRYGVPCPNASAIEYMATIPAAQILTGTLYYYFQASDGIFPTVNNGTAGSPYSLTIYAAGNLQGQIEPAEARALGAQWRYQRVGDSVWSDWNDHNDSFYVRAADYTVQFSSIANYYTPTDQTKTVTSGATTTATGTYNPHTGFLQVTITPAAANTAGAQWKAVNAPISYDSGWQDSGTTLSGLIVSNLAGNYTVQFKTLTGWTAPANITGIAITNGVTATRSGAYVRQTGTLNVNITDDGSGASFSIAGPTDFTPLTGQTSNYSQTVPTGDYTVTYTTPADYDLAVTATSFTVAANVASGTLAQSATETVDGTYSKHLGSLQVTIEPQGARDAGAQWRYQRQGDSTWSGWQNSGTTISSLFVGTYNVQYSQIDYWDKPADEAVTVSKDTTATTTGTYVQHFGSLHVTIEPPDVRTLGASWSIDGTNWYAHDYTLTGIPGGPVTVQFSSVTDWYKPVNQGATILKDATTEVTGTYTIHAGSLTVTIEPAEARTAGAQWSINSGADWYNSGYTLTDMPVGNYTVTFKAVATWNAPADAVVLVEENLETTYTGTYMRQKGHLRAFIQPLGARQGGAQWSLDGTTWKDSGDTIYELVVGEYTVRFKEIAGWTTPADITTNVYDAQVTSETGTYAQFTGSLRVYITPADAIAVGGAWSIDGSTWYGSGYVIDGLLVGPVTVQFRDATGWNTPSDQTVSITKNTIVSATGAYTRQMGSLNVVIDPEEARTAGARWRLQDTTPTQGASPPQGTPSPWYAGGYTLTNLSTGSYIVEFNDLDGWLKPADTDILVLADQQSQIVLGYSDRVANVKGRVVDVNGSPIWDVSVVLTGSGKTYTAYVGAADNGYYEIKAPLLGNSTCEARKQDYYFTPAQQGLIISAKGDYTLADFVGEYDPAQYTISGKVQTAGGKAYEAAVLRLNNGITATSNVTGAYRFEGLRKGDYTVSIDPIPDIQPNRYSAAVKILKSDVANVDFILTPVSLTINGKVLQSDGTTGICGMIIQLGGDVTSYYSTRSNGSFEFTGLVGGGYSLTPDTDRVLNPTALSVALTDFDSDNNNFIDVPPALSELKVGDITVTADAITKTGFGLYRAAGNVFIGLAKILKSSSDMDLDLLSQTMEGSGQIGAPSIPSLGSLSFFDGLFNILGGELLDMLPDVTFNFYFFEFTVTKLEIYDDHLEFGVDLLLPQLLGGLEVGVEMGIYNTGPVLRSFEINIPEVSIGGSWSLTDTKVYYIAEDTQFGGQACLNTPAFGVEASIAFYKGKLDAIHIVVYADIPIHPPELYLTHLGGGVANLANDKPIEINAVGGVGTKKLGTIRFAEANISLTVSLSGAFRGEGEIFVLGIKTGGGMVEYNHPERHFGFGAWWTFGYFPLLVELSGEFNLKYSPLDIWGFIKATIYIPIRVNLGFWKYEKDFVIGDAGGEFCLDWVRIWASVLGATLEAFIDGDGFRITKPSWLTWAKIEWTPEGDVKPTVAFEGLPPNAEKEHSLPGNLSSVHFFIAWEQGDTDPRLVSPSGQVFSGSDPSPLFFYFKDAEGHIAVFTVYHPEGGTWEVELPGENSLGEFYIEATPYGMLPGVAILSAEEIGVDQILIKMARSNFEGECVDLFYRSTKGGRMKHIACPEEIGTRNEWMWDTSKVVPGTYNLYARVYDAENHPFTYRYGKTMTVSGDKSYEIEGRPKVKISKGEARLTWERMADPNLSYYKVYFSDDPQAELFPSFVEVEPKRHTVTLDSSKLKRGRMYKVAVAAVFDDGTEGPLSGETKFIYRTRGINHLPYVESKPKTTIKLGRSYRYNVVAKDLDKDDLYYSLRIAPKGMAIDYRTGKISWKPADAKLVGLHRVHVVVADAKGGQEVQAYEVNVRDTNRQGMLEMRPVYDERGRRAFVVSYWNPNLNLDTDAVERLQATFGSYVDPAGAPLVLEESGTDHGYFAGYISAEQVDRVVRSAAAWAADAGVSVSSVDLNTLVVKMRGESRRESVAFKNDRNIKRR